MCGLVAMIAKTKYGFQFKDQQMFDQLLYANALRGEDSTGVFGINKYGNLQMIKSAKPSADFIRTKGYKDFSSKVFSEYRIVVGHNRASTRGATTDQNAHPFIEDHICLVHNGTLNSHKELADTTVDSHAIATAIARDGYKETLPKINGAFALIWYDAKAKKLMVGRNSQRPLWIMQTKDVDIIASEPEMLTWLHKRVYGSPGEAPKFFAVESLYSWDIDDLEVGLALENMPVKKAVLPSPIVLPPLMTANKTLVEVGSSSSQTLAGSINYKQGQVVTFEHLSNSLVGTTVTFHGRTTDAYHVLVQASHSIANLTKEEIEDLLDNSELLTGEYIGYSKPRNNMRVFLTNVKVIKEYTTCNHQIVTLQQIANAGHCCHDCGTIIEPEDDDTLFWARVKGGEIKRMLCPTCVGMHPKLSALLEEQETCTQNELSSLDINLDLDQYAYLESSFEQF